MLQICEQQYMVFMNLLAIVSPNNIEYCNSIH